MMILLTYKFVSSKVKLSWNDILYAIERKILPSKAAIEHAMDEISTKEKFPEVLIDLASLNNGEWIHPYLNELASMEPEQDVQFMSDKWMYLTLSWLFYNKDKYLDPFEIVEQIYADFGYSELISNFIPYMPSDDPDLGSVELNKARLYKKWENYLDSQEKRFS